MLRDRLSARMGQLGLTQGELAKRVGVSQPTIWKLISGETTNSRFMLKIARELDTSVEWLIGDAEEPDPGEITPSEREWLELLRGLVPEDRAAVLTLTRSLATSASSPRLQAPRIGYRGKG